MANDNSDHAGTSHRRPPGYDSDSPGRNSRHEPRFSGIDDRDAEDYEEPDRDTGFASGFDADDLEEELDDLFDDDSDRMPSREASEEEEEDPDLATEDWAQDDEYYDVEDEAESGWPLRLLAVAAVAVILVAVGAYGIIKERTTTQEELRELRATLATSSSHADLRTARDSLRELQQSYDSLAAKADALARENRELRATVAGPEAPLPDAEQQTDKEQPMAAKTPVAVDFPEPVTTLNEALSMGAEISKNRQAPRAAETVTQPAVAAPEPAPAAPAAAPDPVAPAAPAPVASIAAAEQVTAASPAGRWFVNFGSYSSRSMAESWATRLRPGRGEVIVAPSSKDGRTYYRVRVVGLGDKGAADLVARQLETEMQVSRLWVGQE